MMFYAIAMALMHFIEFYIIRPFSQGLVEHCHDPTASVHMPMPTVPLDANFIPSLIPSLHSTR